MGLVKIFVEGDGDKKFIQDITKYCTNLILDTDIIIIGGWEKISSSKNEGEAYRIEFQKNNDMGGTNLVIFDSDDDFQSREETLIQWSIKYSLSFELFLFPNNNDNGELESLLETIINPIHQGIFNCWTQYENCVARLAPTFRPQGYTLPARKSKIYSYLEALQGNTYSQKKLCKDPFRNYLEEEHWNLQSPNLRPLINFLRRNLMN
jgi:hypothetical protein